MMDSFLTAVFIIITLLVLGTIWFLTAKYFLKPLFFKPKLSSFETFEFLEKYNAQFVEKRDLSKGEKEYYPFSDHKGTFLNNTISTHSAYIIVGFSPSTNRYHFFWLELTQWPLLHLKFVHELLTGKKIGKKRSIRFKEIVERQVLTSLKTEYIPKIALLDINCPACREFLADNISKCPNCGLFFIN